MRFKTHIIALVVAILLIAFWFIFCVGKAEAPQEEYTPDAPDTFRPLPPDTDNFTFDFDGESVTLVNGVYIDTTGPDSSMVRRIEYFGNEGFGDLNADGLTDTALVVSVDGGGSGIFFYVVAIVSTSDGYVGTNAALLGDRIAPQTTEIRDGVLVVNFADRAPGEAMAAVPSIGKTYQYMVHGVTLEAMRE